MRVPGKALSLALGAGTLLIGGALQAETRIVTSIKPVELIVSAIATDDMQTTTLVPPGSSPHNYTMKPSQRRALENADVIFWVGPDMETFLARLLASGEFRDRTVALLPGDDAEAHAHDDHGDDYADHDDHDDHGEHHEDHGEHDDDNHAGHHEHHHDHGGEDDPHIWLDPALAGEIAETMEHALAEQDGVDREALTRNLAQFKTALKQTEAEIQAKLAPVKDISLYSYHNAFVRFAEHYGLNLEGTLTLNPELSPGARHIAQIQERLGKAHHPCLLTEPQFNPGAWEVITEKLDVTFSTWDPLATEVAEGPDGYLAFQHQIADAVLKCLPEDAEH